MSPQISLYFDETLYKEVKCAAKKKEVSISSFVSDIVKEYLNDEWPEGYFDLMGSVNDDSFQVLDDVPFTQVTKREDL